MTTQNHPRNGSKGANPNPPADDSDPTGRYRSSAAERVQQNVVESDVPEESTEVAAESRPETETVQSPTERFPWMKDTRQWGGARAVDAARVDHRVDSHRRVRGDT